jgi:hypothetical protein
MIDMTLSLSFASLDHSPARRRRRQEARIAPRAGDHEEAPMRTRSKHWLAVAAVWLVGVALLLQPDKWRW